MRGSRGRFEGSGTRQLDAVEMSAFGAHAERIRNGFLTQSAPAQSLFAALFCGNLGREHEPRP
jgi:hypothetical protein